MTPTNELRWIERETVHTYMSEQGVAVAETICVLQQKWCDTAPRYSWYSSGINREKFEWRDVPVVKDEPLKI